MPQLDFQIQLCSPDTLRPLRLRVLRPGRSPEVVIYPADSLSGSFHLAAIYKEQVIGAASWMPEAHPGFQRKNPYRLRGMATDPQFQGKGVGKALIQESLRQLQSRSVDFAWCNAREVAFTFYSRLGFRFYGELFDIPDIGPHKVMYRELKTEN